VALQVEEQLGSVVVLPFACVYGPATQADDDRHMLNPYRALLLTRPAGGALERGLLGNVNGHQRFGSSRAVGIQIIPDTERDLFGIEDLAGVVGRTMLGAAAALDAGVGLQRDELGDVLARIEPEILIVGQRWNSAESIPFEENRQWTQDQVQVLGMGNQRQENQQRQCMDPPVHPCGGAALLGHEREKL